MNYIYLPFKQEMFRVLSMLNISKHPASPPSKKKNKTKKKTQTKTTECPSNALNHRSSLSLSSPSGKGFHICFEDQELTSDTEHH